MRGELAPTAPLMGVMKLHLNLPVELDRLNFVLTRGESVVAEVNAQAPQHHRQGELPLARPGQ